jgi:hypothetical protein
MKIRKEYSKEVEGAWFALKEFIHPLEFLRKQGKEVFPANSKLDLTFHYSKIKLAEPYTFQPFQFSKRRLEEHLKGFETYYYRSKRYSRHQEGYGRSDLQAQKLSFSSDFNISQKKKSFNQYFVMLCGIDLDCHHNEPDVLELQTWLQTNYLKHSYWEPSSNKKGRHGYFKLAYPDYLNLGMVKSIIKEFYNLLNQRRISAGFKAPIDIPCGLPCSIYYDSSADISGINFNELLHSNISDSTQKQQIMDIRTYFESIEPVSYLDECEDDAENHTETHSDNSKKIPYSRIIRDYETYQKIKDIKFPVQLKMSQGIKIPRFNSSCECCNMNDIKLFYQLPYYDLSELQNMLHALQQEENSCIELSGDRVCDTAIVRTPLGYVQESEDSTARYAEKENMDVTASSTDSETKEECIMNHSGSGLCDTAIVRTPQGVCTRYQEQIEQCRSIQDKPKKTNKFYWYYSVYLGYVPTVEEAIAEYIKQGMNMNPDPNSPNRIKRFEQNKTFIEARFHQKQWKLSPEQWEKEKNQFINYVMLKIEEQDLSWSKDSKKKYKLAPEELALIYYAIHQSNLLDQKKSNTNSSFSYQQINAAFENIYQKKCHRNKTSKIIKILQASNLIEKVSEYKIGEKGTGYKAIAPKKHA